MDARLFNPYIVHMNVGELQKNQRVNERMCMWYEIELIRYGDGGVVTLDQFLPAAKGVIYIRKPGMIVRGVPPYGYNGIVFDVIYDAKMEMYYELKGKVMEAQFDKKLLRHFYERGAFFDFLENLPPSIETKNYDLYAHLLENCFHLFLKGAEDFQLQAKTLLYQIIVALLDEQYLPSGADAGARQMIFDIQRYIDSHYMNRIDLQQLARRGSLSREHFCRLFKRVVGCAPIEYLQSVRLFHAKQLLVITSDANDHIAAQCGFSSSQHFYDVFRRTMNMTPRQYRAQRQNLFSAR